ncbi:hypothetical protein E1832_08685 [Antarcticimicrobium luteum]|uniref:Uncharacterized protein n=1 Tax=Antarcticimicrobium luteum TaxID=2547397 RepID=A0A4R5VBV2_9RHOB|nr:hypothetical protein E1832_08685 [Antarcticimicrobium luteum]
MEAVIGQTRDQWEPDGTSAEPYSGTPAQPIGWTDAEGEGAREDDPRSPTIEDAAKTADADDRAAARSAADPEVEDLAADEAVIDEDSLRELVAEIVRQELQGALGERITRNVRKLVRREIHRALAAQDLD